MNGRTRGTKMFCVLNCEMAEPTNSEDEDFLPVFDLEIKVIFICIVIG
jgi:hypothetical protein